MILVPLGVNGYLPINGRHTSCFLALFEDAAFIFDAGTGAARLHQPEILALLEPYREVHLLLSHYHVDHTVGLYYAFTALRGRTFHIHGPACPFMPVNPREAVERYFSPPLNSYGLDDSAMEIHPLNAETLTIAGHTVRVWPQKHPGGSVGLRIDDAVAYVTDTVVMMENASQAGGVSLLLHELWLDDADAGEQAEENQRHACFGPVSDFIAAARPARFMPVHLYAHYSDERLAAMVRAVEQRSGVPSEIPEEGRSYRI